MVKYLKFNICADFRDIKELNSSQARISVETAREVASDKTLKTKNDKDRKLREKKQNNTKKFMDERKVAKMRQDKERERLRKKHEKQLDELNKTFHNVSLVKKIGTFLRSIIENLINFNLPQLFINNFNLFFFTFLINLDDGNVPKWRGGIQLGEQAGMLCLTWI